MTDENVALTKIDAEAKKAESVFKIVYLGFIISGIIALSVIVGVIALSIYGAFKGLAHDKIVPAVLENWGGVIVGFYFGAFVSLIKDYMKPKN